MAQRARTLIVFGTTSDAGKSTLTAALCRAFSLAVDVAPFKARTWEQRGPCADDGGEIALAQGASDPAPRDAGWITNRSAQTEQDGL